MNDGWLDEVASRYSRALDTKPSKGDFANPSEAYSTMADSVADIPDLIAEIKAQRAEIAELRATPPLASPAEPSLPQYLSELPLAPRPAPVRDWVSMEAVRQAPIHEVIEATIKQAMVRHARGERVVLKLGDEQVVLDVDGTTTVEG